MPRKKPKGSINKKPITKKAKSIALSQAKMGEILGKTNWKNLFQKSDISSLVAFRLFFGFLMCYESISYLLHEGWIYSYWVQDLMHFTFWPFDFVQPLPGKGMYVLFICLALLGVLIAIGLFYRLATITFFLGFTYMFLMEETSYLNHFYLICLVSFLMIFVPANRAFSIDSKIFKPIHSEVISVWPIWLLRFMIGVPYFFGGIAKIKADWLQGEPLKTWLSYKDMPLIGQFFDQEWMAILMSYSGLFLDLLIVPALLFRKTRLIGFILISTFHMMNSHLFTIGVFPWFMIAATTIFFDPDWFRNVLKKIKIKWKYDPSKYTTSKMLTPITTLNRPQKIIVLGLALWMLFHVSFPLRHFFIPGNVTWTEEGYYFSWHMMLREKKAIAEFTMVNNQTGEEKKIVVDDYLPIFQRKVVFIQPKMIWEFANNIADIYKRLGFDVAMHADVKVSLNGRKFQQFIDPTVDLTQVPHPTKAPVSWIVPLTTDLTDRLEE